MFQKIDFFFEEEEEEATCPGQLRCLVQSFFQKSTFFLKKPLVLGSFAAWGRTFSQEIDVLFEEATCPAAALPGAELFSKNVFLLKKSLIPGSLAAWGRTFLLKVSFFEQTTCPGQLRCLGQNVFFLKSIFFEQATCPGQLRCLVQNFFSKYDFL